MDQISDEYSSFYLNHSEFPVNSTYMFFEDNLLKTTDNVLKSFIGKQNKLNLIRSIKDMDFIGLKLINKSQRKYNEIVTSSIFSQCENDLFVQLDEFLIKNSFLDRNSNIFNHIIEVNEEEKNSKNKNIKQIIFIQNNFNLIFNFRFSFLKTFRILF